MGDVGRHLAALLVGQGQVGAHPVERCGQLAQFVPGAHRHLVAHLAAGDHLRGRRHLAHRPGDRARQEETDDQGHPEGDERAQ